MMMRTFTQEYTLGQYAVRYDETETAYPYKRAANARPRQQQRKRARTHEEYLLDAGKPMEFSFVFKGI